MWFRAWVNAVDNAATGWPNAFHLSQSNRTGLFIMGGSDWRDYVVTSTITMRLGRSFGLVARVRGLRRYYGFVLTANQSARIVRRCGESTVLGELEFPWEFERPYEFRLEVFGKEIAGSLDGKQILKICDTAGGVDSGGFGFICDEGLILSDEVCVEPVGR